MHRRYHNQVQDTQPHSSERGAAQLEFLVSVFTLMFLLFAAFELTMMIYTYVVIGAAAKAGVRYAIVHGTQNSNCSGPTKGCADSAGANVTAVVKRYAALSLHDTSSIIVHANYLDSSSAPSSRIQVLVGYTYVPYVRLPWISPELVASAEGRIVN